MSNKFSISINKQYGRYSIYQILISISSISFATVRTTVNNISFEDVIGKQISRQCTSHVIWINTIDSAVRYGTGVNSKLINNKIELNTIWNKITNELSQLNHGSLIFDFLFIHSVGCYCFCFAIYENKILNNNNRWNRDDKRVIDQNKCQINDKNVGSIISIGSCIYGLSLLGWNFCLDYVYLWFQLCASKQIVHLSNVNANRLDMYAMHPPTTVFIRYYCL